MSEAQFDTAGEKFIAYYDQVRGRVREDITRRNLIKFLPPQSAQILDFGGGDGRDALWLAEQEHQVTVLDKSQVMLGKAQANIDKSSPDIASRVTLRQGDAQELQTEIGVYDVVLSHGVLMYEVDDPISQLRTLSRVLKPHGILSLLTKGLPGAIQEAVAERDIDRADQLFMTGRYINHRGLPARAYQASELLAMLAHVSLETIDWFGVRLLTNMNYELVSEVEPRVLHTLFHLEHAQSRQHDSRGMGQMLHFIARRI